MAATHTVPSQTPEQQALETVHASPTTVQVAPD